MLRNRLRAATRAHHDRIERRLALTSPAFGSVEAYSRLLQRFLGFHDPLDRALARFAGAFRARGLPIEERLKAGRLEHDLAALGLPAGRIRALPRCAALPALRTFDEALGCLYVTEGATLGGRILTRHFATLLPRDLDALAYFGGYGERTGAMWNGFVRFLDAHDAGGEPADRAVRAAQETFECLERWMTAPAVATPPALATA